MTNSAGPVIGILGGGQLGRMLAVAAAQLGCTAHVYDPEVDCPASHVAARCTTAAYDDAAALAAFAADIDVATFEFENVPAAAAMQVASLVPLMPRPEILETAQDRLREKAFARDLGIATPAFCAVDTAADLRTALIDIGAPSILKTRRLGYDGKGQVRLATTRVGKSAIQLLAGQPCILEAVVPFTAEISILCACADTGDIVFYPPVQNHHASGILRHSQVPARISAKAARRAIAATRKIADALGYVGVLAVEFFCVGDDILFNEIAPRVHNSGHWTIEGARTSQFENHIRAICHWPLGDARAHGRIDMHNLIGRDILQQAAYLAKPGWHVHNYGKADIKPLRKMGHVTQVRP